MGKKSKTRKTGFYSTDPDFQGFDFFNETDDAHQPVQQRLRIRIEKKGRRGKVVTIIEGYEGSEEELQDLGRQLKSRCGVGGSAKDRLIILQGDVRNKVVTLLKDLGHEVR